MFTPTVIESPPQLEPVSRDPFADAPEEPTERAPVDRELVAIVRAAAAGDAAAVSRLVDRFEQPLRAVTRFYRLSKWDADDVIQATWLQFLEHGRTLREPAAVSGWLKTTARRQSLRVLQGRMREQPTDDPALGDDGHHREPHDELVAAERRAALLGALAELPARNRQLMTLLVAKPDISYEQVSDAIGMPIGSIGPTRLRAISRLQRSSRLRALQLES
jgi:RNA polymerase sigma factor (sigma-70 family)